MNGVCRICSTDKNLKYSDLELEESNSGLPKDILNSSGINGNICKKCFACRENLHKIHNTENDIIDVDGDNFDDILEIFIPEPEVIEILSSPENSRPSTPAGNLSIATTVPATLQEFKDEKTTKYDNSKHQLTAVDFGNNDANVSKGKDVIITDKLPLRELHKQCEIEVQNTANASVDDNDYSARNENSIKGNTLNPQGTCIKALDTKSNSNKIGPNKITDNTSLSSSLKDLICCNNDKIQSNTNNVTNTRRDSLILSEIVNTTRKSLCNNNRHLISETNTNISSIKKDDVATKDIEYKLDSTGSESTNLNTNRNKKEQKKQKRKQVVINDLPTNFINLRSRVKIIETSEIADTSQIIELRTNTIKKETKAEGSELDVRKGKRNINRPIRKNSDAKKPQTLTENKRQSNVNRRSTDNKSNEYKCSICQQVFGILKDLVSHMRIEHRDHDKNDVYVYETNGADDITMTARLKYKFQGKVRLFYECRACYQIHNKYKSHIKHIKIMHQADDCNRWKTKRKPNAIKREIADCPLCPRKFYDKKRMGKLANHMFRCHKGESYEPYLKQHEKTEDFILRIAKFCPSPKYINRIFELTNYKEYLYECRHCCKLINADDDKNHFENISKQTPIKLHPTNQTKQQKDMLKINATELCKPRKSLRLMKKKTSLTTLPKLPLPLVIKKETKYLTRNTVKKTLNVSQEIEKRPVLPTEEENSSKTKNNEMPTTSKAIKIEKEKENNTAKTIQSSSYNLRPRKERKETKKVPPKKNKNANKKESTKEVQHNAMPERRKIVPKRKINLPVDEQQQQPLAKAARKSPAQMPIYTANPSDAIAEPSPPRKSTSSMSTSGNSTKRKCKNKEIETSVKPPLKEIPMLPFECSYCEQSFTGFIQYNAHILTEHRNKTSYRCVKCNYSFISENDLETHMKNKHSSDSLLNFQGAKKRKLYGTYCYI